MRTLVTLSATASGNVITSASSLAMIDDAAAVAPTSKIIGGAIAYDTQDSATQISYSVSAFTAILSGKRPPSAPWLTAGYDPDYPTPSPSLPDASDTKASSATVGVQAQEFIRWCASLSRDIDSLGSQTEDYTSALVADSCKTCPSSTSVQDIQAKLTKVCVAMQNYVNVTVTSNLISYVNSSQGTSLTEVFSSASILLSNSNVCSDCLVSQVKINNAKLYKKCIASKKSSSEEKSGKTMSCGEYQKRSSDRYGRIIEKHLKHKRKQGARLQNGYLQSSSTVTVLTVSSMQTVVTNLVSTSSSITDSSLKSSFTVLSSAFANLQAVMASQSTLVQNVITSSVNTSTLTLNAMFTNSSQLVNTTVLAIMTQVSNDADLYPNCQITGNATLTAQAKYSLSSLSCMATSDQSTTITIAQQGVLLSYFATYFQRFMTASDACYSVCSSFNPVTSCLNNWFISFWNIGAWNSCIRNVNR